ncbi:MAG TPA: hypothetical protein VII52_07865, partial [Gemmatimonadaceae bacterium]
AGETLGARLLASLRIAKPKTVTAVVPVAGGPSGGRQLQNVIAGILAETTTVSVEDPDTPVPTADSASHVAGFSAQLVRARHDLATIEVLGQRRVTLDVNRAQLRTLLAEAGRPDVVADSLDGRQVTLARPRGIRLQYGHCPAPIANTLQSQVQGPPPPSTDNGNCIILTEAPLSSVTVPPGLDTTAVMEIALELSGMSPDQARDFRSLFAWPSALGLSAPRAMRSYEITHVGSAAAMLMISAGRREPAYFLVWARDGVVFTLAGYGSSGDAVPFASSVS